MLVYILLPVSLRCQRSFWVAGSGGDAMGSILGSPLWLLFAAWPSWLICTVKKHGTIYATNPVLIDSYGGIKQTLDFSVVPPSYHTLKLSEIALC